MRQDLKVEALRRLRGAAGHLEGVRRMAEADVYCVDVMKQLAAVQGSLEAVQAVLLRNHLSTCVSDAVRHGMGEAVIDELMGALRYDKRLLNGHAGPGTVAAEAASGHGAGRACSCHGEPAAATSGAADGR